MKNKFLLTLLFLGLFTLPAFASNNNDPTLEAYICSVFNYLTGTVGKALAAFACVGVSLAFFGGKIQWTTVLVFAIAMACIFGAPQIVRAFSGGTGLACDNVQNTWDGSTGTAKSNG